MLPCHCERSVAIFVPSESEESRSEIASSFLTSFGIPRNDNKGESLRAEGDTIPGKAKLKTQKAK
jgi:hypothetical protein